MKHVLLTGAGGFIGSHVLEHILKTTEWNVSVTSRSGILGRITEVVDGRQPCQCERVRYVGHDLSQPWPTKAIASLTNSRFGPVDVVINCASEANVDRSVTNPRSVAANNVALMLEMLELARVIQPTAFIHLSTGEVYGAARSSIPTWAGAREWDPILPPNPYSASKAAQEAFAIAYWRSFGVPAVIVNCQNVFGERQHPDRFVPKTIARILAGEPVPIYGSAGVPSRRTFQHARNLASALCFLAEIKPTAVHDFPAQFDFPDRYNVTGEVEADNYTMAEMIAQTLGRPFTREIVDTATLRPGHDARYALDGSKIAKLGWTAPVPMWESLERTVRWTIAHPEWLA